ncbi:MAG: hypothetical protein J0H26_01320, partial [Alphaproteobacteria bacterium]|nr:hypothetical protein [Alphaproteobacteria bacterium]
REGGKEVLGEQRGTELNRVVRVVAKPGYAVGAITTKSGLGLDGFSVTFMKVRENPSTPRPVLTVIAPTAYPGLATTFAGRDTSVPNRLPAVSLSPVRKTGCTAITVSLGPNLPSPTSTPTRYPLPGALSATSLSNPPPTVRRVAGRYRERATYHELNGHSHWMIGEPGWEGVAARTLAWLDETLAQGYGPAQAAAD